MTSSFGWTIILTTWTRCPVTPVAQWLVEFLRNAEAFPSSAAVPEGAIDVLDALIGDWTEVLTAHDEGFLAELKKASME
ncbi:hypothetical protein [Bradyrhizobium sp.]|uniref:hypothetical protein n=1 Tax=Bradyrhizobium sp. TaxID=376 RepID=UPI003C335592